MSPPPLSCPGVGFSTPSQGANNPLIDIEVAALIEKGAAASSSSQLHQQHFLGAEEEWEDAPHHQS
jgi:hypothetical protein